MQPHLARGMQNCFGVLQTQLVFHALCIRAVLARQLLQAGAVDSLTDKPSVPLVCVLRLVLDPLHATRVADLCAFAL